MPELLLEEELLELEEELELLLDDELEELLEEELLEDELELLLDDELEELVPPLFSPPQAAREAISAKVRILRMGTPRSVSLF